MDENAASVNEVPADEANAAGTPDAVRGDLQQAHSSVADEPVEDAAASGSVIENAASTEGSVEEDTVEEDTVEEDTVEEDTVEEDTVEEQSSKQESNEAELDAGDADIAVEPEEIVESAAVEPEGDCMRWYVLKVQSNREKSIRNSLLRRIKRERLDEFFGEVIIPTEKVVEQSKGGKSRVTERKLYPGYIMIHMILNDETWYLIRDTGGVGDFTGAAGKPIPMQDEEIKRMLGLEETKEAEPAKIKIDFEPGETVKIKEGSFESFEGAIDEIDEEHGKIIVLVEIFGRSVPTELDYWQVERV